MASSMQNDLRNPKYRFAYDVAKTVEEVRGKLYPLAKLPEPEIAHFTEQHAKWIQEFLVTHGKAQDLEERIERYLVSYDDVNIKFSMKYWKDLYDLHLNTFHFPEYEFICTCARIAYIGAYIVGKKRNNNALNLAVNYIHNWIELKPRYPFLPALFE